jgi:hypothetical protein
MGSADESTPHALSLPARLRSVAGDLAERLGGHVPEPDDPRPGCTLWSPFGFVPMLVDDHGARGLHAAAGATGLTPEQLPVVWWDAMRGQLAPLGGTLEAYLEVVRSGVRLDRSLTEESARLALSIDPGAAPAAVALAGHHLDQGRREEAEVGLVRAANAASWWMAPCLLLTGLLRVEGRNAEAAAWCAEALSRRWDATGAGLRGMVPRLGDEPRRLLRGAVAFLRRHEKSVPGLRFDASWRCLRDAADPLDASAHEAAAAELAGTGRLAEAAQRWEWLALAHGVEGAARQAEEAYATLSWPLHRSHSRLLQLVAAR